MKILFKLITIITAVNCYLAIMEPLNGVADKMSIDDKFIYVFQQKIDLMQRATEKDEPVRNSFRRYGLLLLESKIEDSRWERTVYEYATGKDFLLERNNVKRNISRNDLLDRHNASFSKESEMQFGMVIHPAEIKSNLNNTDFYFSNFPLENVRYDLLSLPTILQPNFYDKNFIKNKERSKVIIAVGDGDFEIAYYVESTIIKGGLDVYQMKIIEEPVSDLLGDIELILNPSGEFSATFTPFSKRDKPAPNSIDGDYRLSIRARLENIYGQDVDVEVMQCEVEYHLKLIHGTFDDESVYIVEPTHAHIIQ